MIFQVQTFIFLHTSLISMILDETTLHIALRAQTSSILTLAAALLTLLAFLILCQRPLKEVGLWTALALDTASLSEQQYHSCRIETTKTKALVNSFTSTTRTHARETWLKTCKSLIDCKGQGLVFEGSIFETNPCSLPKARLLRGLQTNQREEVDAGIQLEDVIAVTILRVFDGSTRRGIVDCHLLRLLNTLWKSQLYPWKQVTFLVALFYRQGEIGDSIWLS